MALNARISSPNKLSNLGSPRALIGSGSKSSKSEKLNKCKDFQFIKITLGLTCVCRVSIWESDILEAERLTVISAEPVLTDHPNNASVRRVV